MCEPEYAALLFSKHCTSAVRYKYDGSTRSVSQFRLQELNTKLEDSPSAVIGLVNSTTNCRPKKGRPESRAPRNSVFALKHQVKVVMDRRAVYNRARDRKGLAEWEGLQQGIITSKRKLSGYLVRYLEQVQESHEDDLKNIKESRRLTIIARLKELGWTDEDMTFPIRGRFRIPEDQEFHVLVEAPKPLTDRIWSNILPRLTKILEENRERNNIYNAKKRCIERRQCVDQFLMDMKFNDHPFAPMLDALGVGVPPPPDLSEIYEHGPISYIREALYLEMEDPLEIANPFPKTETVLEWDCLRDLSDTEMTVQDVKTKLEERKAQIEEKVLEWRAMAEDHLLEVFGSRSNITDATLADRLLIDRDYITHGHAAPNSPDITSI
ncbi:hypothetical protein FRC12_011972 [Ceratobasidium sp. 428]|nr:hypothetical protein FRC12_011972 [Ceratobasidium sp. 428]